MPLDRQKGSKIWHYRFQIAGVRFLGTTRSEAKGEARAIEDKAKADVRAGQLRPHRRQITLNEAFERYMVEVGDHAASADDIERELEYLLALGAQRYLSEIGDSELAEYVARARGRKARRFAGKGKRGRATKRLVGPRTVNSQIETLRAVFRRAAKVWRVHVGDMPDWSKHLLPEPDGRIRELTASEETALFEKLRPDFHGLVRFALATGLRLGNCRALTWSQVDFDTGLITVTVKSKSHDGGRLHTLPITREMAAIISAEVGRHDELVFTYVCQHSSKGRRKGQRLPFTKNGWRKAWRQALEAARIEDLKFHDLRHTRATRALRRSNLRVVQRLLGHADIASTVRYAHAELDDVRRALEDDAPALRAEGSKS